MTIRIKLDELLTQSGKTAKEVSAATGIMEGALSEWRNNKITKMDLRTLVKLCRYFNCTLPDLIEYVPDPPPQQPAVAEDTPPYDPHA